jgi:hypothetical protein
MKPKINKAVRISIGVVFLVFFLFYVCFEKDWARLPFYIMLIVISLYNLIWNRPTKD